MSIKISYKNNLPKNKLSNLIFFVDEKYNLSGLKKYFGKLENKLLLDIIKSQNLSKKIISLDITTKKKIFFISGKKI